MTPKSIWHPSEATCPTLEQFIVEIEEAGKGLAKKARPSYWPLVDSGKAAYFRRQLPHLRAMWRAAKAGHVDVALHIFQKQFTQTTDCMRLASAVRALAEERQTNPSTH